MRILHVITSLQTGGAEHLMVDLLPRLRSDSNLVELLLFDGTKTPFYSELKKAGIKIHTISNGGYIYNPLFILKLLRFVRKYDIIHTHNTACQLFVPIAKCICGSKAILVTTEHNSTNRRRSIKWFKPIDHWMYNRYESIICIADQTMENLHVYYGHENKLLVIYNGVDVSRFLKPVKNIEGNAQFVITMVSAFREQKDQESLLRALAQLPNNYCLQFVGSGETEKRVQEKCADLGLNDRVTFMGVRQDVPDILEQSDIVVLSSHWEGLSLSSIEGMASGRPFIASDVDGLHEIVEGAGVLFEHGNDKELAEKIQRLCENPDEYRKVAQRCQEKARQYDISVMANNYLELYQQVLR